MITPNIFDDVNTVMKSPTLLDVASHTVKVEILTKRPEMIQYMKKPRIEFQKIVILNDVSNIRFIKKPDDSIIKYALSMGYKDFQYTVDIDSVLNDAIQIGMSEPVKLTKWQLLRKFIRLLRRTKIEEKR